MIKEEILEKLQELKQYPYYSERVMVGIYEVMDIDLDGKICVVDEDIKKSIRSFKSIRFISNLDKICDKFNVSDNPVYPRPGEKGYIYGVTPGGYHNVEVSGGEFHITIDGVIDKDSRNRFLSIYKKYHREEVLNEIIK